MEEVTTIGLDIAKQVFQAHGADASGAPVFSRRITRAKLLAVLRGAAALRGGDGGLRRRASLGPRAAAAGPRVRLIPPAYVKPFVKRQKNDAADAEAICEAAQRPTMRFVPVKSEEQQASAVVFRARDLLVRQRTQIINALRGLLAEYGWVAPKGLFHAAAMSRRSRIRHASCRRVRATCSW